MKKRFKYWWIRVTKRKELIQFVLHGINPELGNIITFSDGNSCIYVGKGSYLLHSNI